MLNNNKKNSMKKKTTEVHLMREKKNQTLRPVSKGLENSL